MQIENHDTGKTRQVGVELELGGLAHETIVGRIHDSLGGTVERESQYAATVKGTGIGDVRVELDALLFREFKVRGALRRLKLDQVKGDLEETIEKMMASEARRFVPFEVVFPPLEITRLDELEPVREALRRGAEGTKSSVFNAFGLHFNPELPKLDVETLLKYLRAFLVNYDDLKSAHAIDSSRRISPFIDPFPKKYARKVLDPAYAPDKPTFIDDYLDDNPTRNRPLDLLPLLAWMDKERVRRVLPDEKISPRPTLHYRMPDCRIDDPEWTLSREWNIWCKVEDLAADGEAVNRKSEQAFRQMRSPWRKLLNWLGWK